MASWASHFSWAGPRCCTEPWCKSQKRASGAGKNAAGGVQERRRTARVAAALYPSVDEPGLPDRRVQPPAFGRASPVSLDLVMPRPAPVERTDDDPGTHRQHARGTPSKCDRCRWAAPGCRLDSLPPGTHRNSRPTGAGSRCVRMLPGGQNRVGPAARSSPLGVCQDCSSRARNVRS